MLEKYVFLTRRDATVFDGLTQAETNVINTYKANFSTLMRNVRIEINYTVLK